MRYSISNEVMTVLCTYVITVAAVIVLVSSNITTADVKKECYKTQQAAYAASSPKIPECK